MSEMPLCGQKNVSSSKNKNINTNYCHSGIIKGWDKASVLFVLVNESLKNRLKKCNLHLGVYMFKQKPYVRIFKRSVKLPTGPGRP